jgi:hypothetical protein
VTPSVQEEKVVEHEEEEEWEVEENVEDLTIYSSSDDFQSVAKRRRRGEENLAYRIPKKTEGGKKPKEITKGGHEKGVSDLLLPSCVSSILS